MNSKEMATPSKKHVTFVGEKMAGKLVIEIPGIGEKTRDNLAKDGITLATQVYGVFLRENQNEEKFKTFIRGFGANSGVQNQAYDAMNGWYIQHQ